MKRICFILPLMMALSGCGKPTPQQIAAGISAAMPILVEGGLVTAAKHSPTTVKSDAAKIITLIDTDLLPLINNNTLSSAVFLPQLEAKLVQIVPLDYEMLVTGAFTASLMAGNIDLNLPAMSANEKSYVLAFVNGIKQGCVLYLAGKQSSLYSPQKNMEYSPAEIVDLPAIEGNPIEVVYSAPKPAGVPPWHASSAIANTYQRATPAGSKPSVAYREGREQHDRSGMVPIRSNSNVRTKDNSKDKMVFSQTALEKTSPKKALAQDGNHGLGSTSTVKSVDFNGRVMLVFSSPAWCHYCKDMEPILSEISSTRTNIHIIDPDAGPLSKAEALKRDVYAIPMYIIYDNGIEVGRHTGVQSGDTVLGWLAQ